MNIPGLLFRIYQVMRIVDLARLGRQRGCLLQCGGVTVTAPGDGVTLTVLGKDLRRSQQPPADTNFFFHPGNCLPICGIGDVVALEIYVPNFHGIIVFYPINKLSQHNIERELMIEKEKEKKPRNVYYTKVDRIPKYKKK